MSPEEMSEIYDQLAKSSQQKKKKRKEKGQLYALQGDSDFAAEIKEFNSNLRMFRQGGIPKEACYQCGMFGHLPSNCINVNPDDSEQVNFVGGVGNRQPRNDPFSNTYNPGWWNNPNFSWKNQGARVGNNMGPGGFQVNPQSRPQQKDGNEELKELMLSFGSKLSNLDGKMSNLDGKISNLGDELGKQIREVDRQVKDVDKYIRDVDQKHTIAIRHLETQFSQLARSMGERNLDQLPSKNVIKPKEQCMAITLRSGKTLPDPLSKENLVKVVEKEDSDVEN